MLLVGGILCAVLQNVVRHRLDPPAGHFHGWRTIGCACNVVTYKVLPTHSTVLIVFCLILTTFCGWGIGCITVLQGYDMWLWRLYCRKSFVLPWTSVLMLAEMYSCWRVIFWQHLCLYVFECLALEFVMVPCI